MKIHEYQAKKLLADYGVPIPKGKIAATAAEARAGAESLGGSVWVVKAQVHAGGRGKGGGIKLARSLDEVSDYAAKMLGSHLVTHQTGADGVLVRKVYIEQGIDIARELYLGVVLDREKQRLCLMASAEGGTEIEVVAAERPEAIHKVWVDPGVGFSGYQGRELAFAAVGAMAVQAFRGRLAGTARLPTR